MSYVSYIDPEQLDVKKLKAEKAFIKDAVIKKDKPLKKVSFPLIALTFFIGALSFAIALSYNNLAEAIINKYSFGQGLWARFLNLAIFTAIAFILIYLAWKKYPDIVVNAIA